LLVTEDKSEAVALAEELNEINLRRQSELKRVLKEARAKVCQNKLDKKKVILVEGENWPQGIVGLVAGKLMEEFARPVIVCETKGNVLKGSARSIDNYDIVAALEEAKQFLTKFGGHKKAAGLSLELSHLSNLYDKLLEIAEVKLTDEDLIAKIKIDRVLEIKDIDLKLVDKIKKLEPFGLGNPRPVFAMENIDIEKVETVGKSKQHLKFRIGNIKAIAFDFGKIRDELEIAQNKKQRIDLAFTIDEDSWDGTRKVQLKIIDIKMQHSLVV
jgi:single-stranded-DNA-specific exonuclease